MTRTTHPEGTDAGGYLPHVDGLRALAVVAVLAYHANPAVLPGGFLGVDIFFVISGFVVTASLTRHGHERALVFLGHFYKRRFIRIVPPLLVVLVATALAWSLLIPRSWLSGEAERVGLYAFAGLANVALMTQGDSYFAPRSEFNPFTHTWSLGIEEQFYLVAPILILATLRRRRAGAAVLAALGVLSLIGFAALSIVDPLQAFFSPLSRLWELAAGSLWQLLVWRQRSSGAARRFEGAAAAGLALTAICLSGAGMGPGLGQVVLTPLATIGTVLLIGVPGAGVSGRVRRVLESPAALWIGTRSYSLYLWHWPWFVLFRWTLGLDSAATIAAAVGLSLLGAAASYAWVERPIRSWRAVVRSPALLVNALFVGVIALGWWGAATAFERRDRISLSQVQIRAIDWYALHHDPTLGSGSCAGEGPRYRQLKTVLVIEHEPCAGPSAHPGADGRSRRLYVLGDSHATALLPLLHRLSRLERWQVSVYQVPGCPYLDLQAPMGSGRPPSCLGGSWDVLQDVVARAGKTDVVLLASLRMARFVDQWAPTMPEAQLLAQHFSDAAKQSRAAAVDDAAAWIEPFLAKGMQVVFMAPLPMFRAPAFRCADPWTRGNPICAKGFQELARDEAAYQSPVREAIAMAIDKFGPENVLLFDPMPALCPHAVCSAFSADGRPLFFDGDHLSRYGNEVLYPSLAGFMARLGSGMGRV